MAVVNKEKKGINSNKSAVEKAWNISFIGERGGYRPVERIIDGDVEIVMPAVSVQNASGFYHAEAERIIRTFPQLYKRFEQVR